MNDEEENLLTLFDRICFSHGDADVIKLATEEALCYLELQELSIILASQLRFRYRPTVVLIDCYGHVVAEVVAILACLRLGIPFVPVSVHDQHAGARRLDAVVKQLRKHIPGNVVSICGASDDRDPALGIFYQADVHHILYLDRLGNLGEQIQVPRFQATSDMEPNMNDDLYILFTSGTSSESPKAVVGSHRSTYRRLRWFRDKFPASPRIARRTRLTFVDSITEILGGLLNPPSILVAVEPETLLEDGLASLLTTMRPTQITLLPSQLALLFLLPIHTSSSLERVIISGEPCPASLVKMFREKLYQKSPCQLINLYGQTETTGDVMAAVLTDLGEKTIEEGVVAVGTPILSFIDVRVTAEQEVLIRGNLANGYLGDTSPFTEFGTGDSGFCKNGIWYIKGRCDDVVKVNGILTSPSEVETAFAKIYDTACAVAAVILHGRVYVVCEHEVPTFSREEMHKAGVPWNLIPARVLCHKIPISSTGAGKVNRSAVRELVRKTLGSDGKQGTTASADRNTLKSIVCDVLCLDACDTSKSFVELGGDSAASVHLLYRLRQASLTTKFSISAREILQADSVEEIELLLRGDGSAKRRRIDKEGAKLKSIRYNPQSTKILSQFHTAVPFIACVDSSPAVACDQDFFYIACQGGLVCKIDANGRTLAHRHFVEWKFEADCLLVGTGEDTCIVACAFNDNGEGLVVALDNMLDQIAWQRKVEVGIKRVPVWVCRGSIDQVWVRSGCNLIILDATNGNIIQNLTLSNESYGRPTADKANNTIWYPGVVLTKASYTQTDVIIQEFDNLAETLGPCYKDGLLLGDKLVLSDSWGQIHIIDSSSKKIQHTLHVANFPLSTPVACGERGFMEGCYDGRLLFFKFGDRGSEPPTKLWEVKMAAAIYARPLVLPDQKLVVVSTTAGDVVVINTTDGTERERHIVRGEIWSDAKVVLEETSCYHIGFGARDSQLHLLKVSI